MVFDYTDIHYTLKKIYIYIIIRLIQIQNFKIILCH